MHIFSVSEFVRTVSDYLEQGLGVVAIKGEITDFKVNKNKLIYFTLKDASSRVLCFALKGYVDDALLDDGTEVRILGTPKLFKGTGGFHVHVQDIQLIGQGVLQRAFELLKNKLEKEGLFSKEYKKPLPRFAETIALITSRDAAAYNDVLIRLNERWGGLTIKHAHVGVQGLGSVAQIVSAIEYVNNHERADVIVLTRGGGSLEDLQSFNNERVVRAVFSSNIPVIVGVGHERDITLAELAADARASTPTNAAELAVPHRREVRATVEHMLRRSGHTLIQHIYTHRQAIDQSLLSIKTWFKSIQDRFAYLAQLLHAYNPAAILKRGYSITYKDGKLIKDVREVDVGDIVTSRLHDGTFDSTVVKT